MTQRLRILLADDDALSREFLAEALASFEADVVACDDGSAASKLFAKESFDAVFTDLRMPRKDGLELIREIKASASVRSRSCWSPPTAPSTWRSMRSGSVPTTS